MYLHRELSTIMGQRFSGCHKKLATNYYNKTIKNENTILFKKFKRNCTNGYYVVDGIMRKEQE